MKTFEAFAKARRQKVVSGIRQITDTQRPNASGENTGSAGNRIEEAKAKEIGRFKTTAEARAAGHRPEDYRGAGVHETMGPHFRPILWVANKPYVKKINEAKKVKKVTKGHNKDSAIMRSNMTVSTIKSASDYTSDPTGNISMGDRVEEETKKKKKPLTPDVRVGVKGAPDNVTAGMLKGDQVDEDWKATVNRKIAKMTPDHAKEVIDRINRSTKGATIFHPEIRELTGGYNSQAINYFVMRKLGAKAGYIKNQP